MRLRSAEADDRGFLVEMARLACALQGRALPAADDTLVLGLLPISQDAAIIATDDGGARLGAAWWHIHDPPLARDGKNNPLPEMALAVIENARDEGVGTALIGELTDRVAERFATLTLNVHVDNPAVRLYRRGGFEIVGGGRGPYGVTMSRSLGSSRSVPTQDHRVGDRADRCRLELDRHRWLRLLSESDAEQLHAVVEANRDHLARWMPWAAGQTFEHTLAFIVRTRVQLMNNDGFQTAILEDGRIVGVVGFIAVSWQNRSTTIGYWLAESAQGRGTMTRAVRVLVEHALESWRLHRVEIRAGVGNARSRAIPERLGFDLEGVKRRAERIGDRYIDQAVYAMRAGVPRHA